MFFAQINDLNVATKIIEAASADNLPIAEDGGAWVETQRADLMPGAIYDPVAGTWANPRLPIEAQIAEIDRLAAQEIATLFGKPAGSVELAYAEINLHARATEIAEKRNLGAILSPEEDAGLDAIKAIWTQIAVIRSAAAAKKILFV